jgi:hypothetical protein
MRFIKKIKNYWFLFVLFSATLVGYLYKLKTLPSPVHVDEAIMIESALGLFSGEFSPLENRFSTTVVANIILGIFVSIFGVDPLIMRLPSVFGALTTLLVFFFFVARVWNNKMAIYGTIILSSMHVFIAYARMALPNITAPLFLCSSLLLTDFALARKKWYWSALTGVVIGVSFYAYTGTKVIIFIILLFLLFKKQLFSSTALFLTLSFLLTILPLLIWWQSSNYFQREKEVNILSNPDFYINLSGKDTIFEVYKQYFTINIQAYFSQSDGSNQYGNGTLLDPLSSYTMLLLPLMLISSILSRKKNLIQINSIIFILFSILFIIALVSFTESPPLSTRLIITLPLLAILLSYSIERTETLYMTRLNKYLGLFISIFIIVLIVLNNGYIYFYKYPRTKDVAFEWKEPLTSIASYIKKQNIQYFYIIANPHTYSEHVILRTMLHNQNKNIRNISTLDELKIVLKSNKKVVIIEPLMPISSISEKKDIHKLIKKNKMFFDIKLIHKKPCISCSPVLIFTAYFLPNNPDLTTINYF